MKIPALELAPAGIRAVAPAATGTPGYRAAPARFSGAGAEQARRLPDDTIAKMALGRLAQADDIARAAVFAASDMAGFIAPGRQGAAWASRRTRVSPVIGTPGPYGRGNWRMRLAAGNPAWSAMSANAGGPTSTAAK